LLRLSPQQVIDCATSAHRIPGRGCEGGKFGKALKYIAETGVCSNAEYPFTETYGTCNESCRKEKLHFDKSDIVVSLSQSETFLEELLDQQPVGIQVLAENDIWRNYQSGVLQKKYAVPENSAMDHGVLAVGYGTTDDNVDFFKVKNHWGDEWGEKGYLRFERHSRGSQHKKDSRFNLMFPDIRGKKNTGKPSKGEEDNAKNNPTKEVLIPPPEGITRSLDQMTVHELKDLITAHEAYFKQEYMKLSSSQKMELSQKLNDALAAQEKTA
jgi:hypothetical protein